MTFTAPAPTDVRDYAKSLGWSLRPEAVEDRLYVLEHPERKPRQLVFPLDVSAPDYVESVRRVLEKIAELHAIPLHQVLASVLSVRDDTLRYGVLTSYRGQASLPLSFATSLLKGAQQVLSAAACTVVKPRAHHPRLGLSEALQLIEHARFGHTEEGSFVLKVSCPIDHSNRRTSAVLDEPDTPFTRLATLTAKRSMERLVSAIESDTLDRLVDEIKHAEMPMLSANFCDALASLHDPSLHNDVAVSFSWAATVPVAARDKRSSTVRIQSDYFARIEDVGREIRPSERHADETFIGTVERLDGAMGDDGRRSGEVVVALLPAEGDSIRARMDLSPEQYEQAVKAHQADGAYVRFTGRLHAGRQPRRVSHLQLFEIVPDR